MAAFRRLLTLAGKSSQTSIFYKELSTTPRVFSSSDFCPSNPAGHVRVGQLSDALLAKEKGSWKELSNEDKIALYRGQFPKGLRESEIDATKQDTGTILLGVGSAVACAVIAFSLFKYFVSPPLPPTMTKEWIEASKEQMSLYQMNPITGHSSKN